MFAHATYGLLESATHALDVGDRVIPPVKAMLPIKQLMIDAFPYATTYALAESKHPRFCSLASVVITGLYEIECCLRGTCK